MPCGENCCEGACEGCQSNQTSDWKVDAVVEFMQAAGQNIPAKPTLCDEKTQKLRRDLIQEELDEYWHACENGDLVAIADAYTDLMVVVIGLGVAHGLANYSEALFEEVHRSNMSKFVDGYTNPSTGKFMKGPSYSPADLAPILEA